MHLNYYTLKFDMNSCANNSIDGSLIVVEKSRFENGSTVGWPLHMPGHSWI